MNKRMYKLELICVKYVPILIALITLIDVILYYFDIDFELINYIAGTSFLTMIPMYISSYVYKFCEYHRMFLHYIVVNKVVMMIDLYIGIPLGRLYVVGVIFNNSRYLCISSIVFASKVWGKEE